MDVENFIEKKEVTIDGTKFLISKIPALQSQQIYGLIMKEVREYGDVAMTYLSRDTTIQMLAYTAYFDGAIWLTLDEEYRINDSCKKVDTLIALQASMIQYNYGFLFDGGLQRVLADLRGERDTSAQA